MELLKLSLFFFYILIFVLAVISIISSRKARDFFIDVHRTKDGSGVSWTRLGSTFVLYISFLLYIYKITFDVSINEYIILSLIILALTGKITQSTFDKTN